jgi:hypothetical protein
LERGAGIEQRVAIFIAAALLALVCGIVLTTDADAHREPRCLGHRATIDGPNTQLRARGHRRVIVGTRHRDVIVGSRRGDWIVGAGGLDVVCGAGGADYVFVGNATRNDKPTELQGGPGADYVDGGFARDRISGGPGDDRIDGEFGGDRILGAGGDDFIRAQRGGDRISGGHGDDHVEASTGRDLVRAGPGDDKVSTGPGFDRVFGDSGHDAIFLVWGGDVGHGGPGPDSLHGGPGEDRCLGDRGRDDGTGCEHRRSIERIHHAAMKLGPAPKRGPHGGPRHRRQRHHRHRHHDGNGRSGPQPFARVRPVRRMEGFLHRLQSYRVIKSASVTTHQLHRTGALSHQAKQAVQRRYQERLSRGRVKRAVFRRSVERYRVRMISAGISNQIDRLRWTPLERR